MENNYKLSIAQRFIQLQELGEIPQDLDIDFTRSEYDFRSICDHIIVIIEKGKSNRMYCYDTSISKIFNFAEADNRLICADSEVIPKDLERYKLELLIFGYFRKNEQNSFPKELKHFMTNFINLYYYSQSRKIHRNHCCLRIE